MSNNEPSSNNTNTYFRPFTLTLGKMKMKTSAKHKRCVYMSRCPTVNILQQHKHPFQIISPDMREMKEAPNTKDVYISQQPPAQLLRTINGRMIFSHGLVTFYDKTTYTKHGATKEVSHTYGCKTVHRTTQNRTKEQRQVGVGLPGSCEAILHSVANIQENSDIFPDHHFIFLVDFSNAFSSVD